MELTYLPTYLVDSLSDWAMCFCEELLHATFSHI